MHFLFKFSSCLKMSSKPCNIETCNQINFADIYSSWLQSYKNSYFCGLIFWVLLLTFVVDHVKNMYILKVIKEKRPKMKHMWIFIFMLVSAVLPGTFLAHFKLTSWSYKLLQYSVNVDAILLSYDSNVHSFCWNLLLSSLTPIF